MHRCTMLAAVFGIASLALSAFNLIEVRLPESQMNSVDFGCIICATSTFSMFSILGSLETAAQGASFVTLRFVCDPVESFEQSAAICSCLPHRLPYASQFARHCVNGVCIKVPWASVSTRTSRHVGLLGLKHLCIALSAILPQPLPAYRRRCLRLRCVSSAGFGGWTAASGRCGGSACSVAAAKPAVA